MIVETYDALALKEPYLELILLGIKTLETRTRCLRKRGGEVLLTSSKTYDPDAWDDHNVGGLLDAEARIRALNGLGKIRGLVIFGDNRPGVPVEEDKAACIQILQPNGVPRLVYPVSNPRRVVEVSTVRLRPDGVTRHWGASQGFFKVPKDIVRLLEAA